MRQPQKHQPRTARPKRNRPPRLGPTAAATSTQRDAHQPLDHGRRNHDCALPPFPDGVSMRH
eukprot:3934728-Lingulodinium_polyedra.AAC.1